MKSKILAILFLSFSFELCGAAEAFRFVDEPSGCFAQLQKELFKKPCAVRALKKGYTFQWENNQVTVSPGASFVLFDKINLRLLTGSFWIVSEQKINVDSGLAQSQISGDVWFEKLVPDKIVIRNLGGVVAVTGPAPMIAQSIAVGFENWFSGINTRGEVEQGFVRPIEVLSFLPRWMRLSHLSKSEVVEKLADYKKAWAPAVFESAELNQEAIHRQMASIEAAALEKKHMAQAQGQQREHFQKMFRERYFSEGLEP